MIKRKGNLRTIRSQKRVKGFTGYLHGVDVRGLPWETNTVNDREISREMWETNTVNDREISRETEVNGLSIPEEKGS